MTATLLRASRSGADLFQPWVGPAPSGDFYVGDMPSGVSYAIGVVARVAANGTVAWSKTLTPGVSGDNVRSVDFGTNGTKLVAVLGRKSSTNVWTQFVTCFNADGSTAWDVTSTDFHVNTPTSPYSGRPVLVDPSGNVFLLAQNTADNAQCLVKLAAADGSVAWVASVTDSTVSSVPSTDAPRGIFRLSGGDIVMCFYGPVYSATTREYIGRFSGTDGSLVWAKPITQTSGSTSNRWAVGVDASDNIYLARRSAVTTSQICLLKLDSSGALTWSNNYLVGGALAAHAALACTSEGVYVPVSPTISSQQRAGMLFVSADGSTTMSLSYYNYGDGFYGYDVSGYSSGTDVFRAHTTNEGGRTKSVYLLDTHGAANDGVYGTTNALTRATSSVTSTTGEGALGTAASLTMKTAFSASTSTSSASGITDGTDLTFEALAPPAAPTVTNATGAAPSTAFGIPIRGGVAVASPIGPTALFGTPVYQLNVAGQATGAEPSTAFGQPGMIDYFGADRGFAASSVPTATTFGTPSAPARMQASGGLATAFGSPALTLACPAAALAPATAFGGPALAGRLAAQGFCTTAFGTPSEGYAARAAGASSTAFGTPAAKLVLKGAASGWQDTTFGGAATPGTVTHMRGQLFRTRWGVPHAERTAA